MAKSCCSQRPPASGCHGREFMASGWDPRLSKNNNKYSQPQCAFNDLIGMGLLKKEREKAQHYRSLPPNLSYHQPWVRVKIFWPRLGQPFMVWSWFWKFPLKMSIFSIFFLMDQKISLRVGPKSTQTNAGWPLNYCGSKVSLSLVGSGPISTYH